MASCKKLDSSCSFVRLKESDFAEIRFFVLQVCENLENPEFFITSDIDSVLPKLLQPGSGVVYGAIMNGQLVGTQAMDYFPKDIVALTPSLRKSLPNWYVESSWSMVAERHRRLGIADRLCDLVDVATYAERGEHCCLATVHPENVASLRLYFGRGFVGIDLIEHHGLIRILLAKGIGVPSTDAEVACERWVSIDLLNKQQHLFENGFICLGFRDAASLNSLCFVRPANIN